MGEIWARESKNNEKKGERTRIRTVEGCRGRIAELSDEWFPGGRPRPHASSAVLGVAINGR